MWTLLFVMSKSINPVSDEQQTIYKPEEAHCKSSNSNMADLTLEPPTWPDVSLKISSIIPLKDQLDKFGLGYLLLEQDTVKDDQDESNKLVEEQFFIEIQVNHTELDSCSSKSSTTNFQDNFNKSFPEIHSCKDLESNYKLGSNLLLENVSSKIDSQSILNELAPYSLLGEHSSEKDLADNVNKLSLESPEEEQSSCKTIPNNICLLTSQSLKKSNSGNKNVQINGNLSSSYTLLEEQGSNKTLQNDLDDCVWDHSDEHSLIAEYLDEQGENVKVEVFTYFCSYCNDTIVDTNSLLSHQYMTHPEKVFKCTVCGPAVVLSKSKQSSDRFLCDKHTMQPSWETNETSEYPTDSSTPEMLSPSMRVSIPSDDFTSLEVSLDGELPYLFDNLIPLDKTMSEEDDRIVDSFPSFNIPFVDMPKDTSDLVDVFIPTIASTTVVASIPTNTSINTVASIPTNTSINTVASIPTNTSINTVASKHTNTSTQVAASIPAYITPVTASIPAYITPVIASIPADITPVIASIPADITPVTASIPADITPVIASIPADITSVTASIPADITPVTASIPADITPVTASIPADITPVIASIPADITPVTASIPADITSVTASIPANTSSPVISSIPVDISTLDVSISTDIPTPIAASIPDVKNDENVEITSIFNATVETIKCFPVQRKTCRTVTKLKLSKDFCQINKNVQLKILEIIKNMFIAKETEPKNINNICVEKDDKYKQFTTKEHQEENCDSSVLSKKKTFVLRDKKKCLNNVCCYCNQELTSKNDKERHNCFSNTQPYTCEQCEEQFGISTELEKHMSNHDSSAKFSCANCGKCYEEKWKLKLHMRIHSDTKLTCDICGQTLKRKGAMREHMYLKHKLGEFRSSCMCEICGEKFMNRFRLAHHRHHFDKESLKCQICSQVYQSMQDLENHMHIHANIDTYNCNACKLVFDTSHDLQEHVKTHKDLRNENCSGVSSKIMLHSPMDERPVIKCSKCYKILSSKQNLNYHMKTHLNEKNYTCNICNESFLTPSARSVHLRVHLDKKPYICEVCDAGFLTATRLKRHEYIHTRDTSYDDRPFSCTVCTKAFRRKDTLYSHMKVHTTERLHSCSDCGRTFKKSNDRNRHRRNNCKISLANGQPPTVYSCPICKKSFESSASASNHLAFVHVLNKNSTEENSMPIGTDEPIISSL